MRDLTGLNSVVVGGGSGIGRGAVLALARRGVNVLVADIRGGAAQSAADEAAAFGVRTAAMTIDATDPAQVDALVSRAYDLFSAVHVLVNSVGIILLRRLEETSPDDWRKIFDVNFFAIVQCCRSFLPRMKAQKTPIAHIANNASFAALVTQAIPGLGLYTATKQALMAYSESLALEEAENGITVSLVACGEVATGLGANSQDYLTAQDQRRPVGGAGVVTARDGVMSAERAGEIIIEEIEAGRFLTVTHPARRVQVVARYEKFLADFDAQAAIR